MRLRVEGTDEERDAVVQSLRRAGIRAQASSLRCNDFSLMETVHVLLLLKQRERRLVASNDVLVVEAGMEERLFRRNVSAHIAREWGRLLDDDLPPLASAVCLL